MSRFPDTQWTLIRRSGETPSARLAAFSELAHAYQPAIAAFFRARLPAADADDATQSFLAASFEHRWWARADAGVGSFRGFLLMLLRRHLGRMRAVRRPVASGELIDTLADGAPDAEHQFDARFVLLLVQRALTQLRGRYRDRGRGTLFDRLVTLLGDPPAHGELQRIAADLGLAPNTLTVELKRLRSRLHDAMRDELRELCADQDSFDAEWAAMQEILGGR